MVPALAFAATAISSLFAQSMLVRYTAAHRPHQRAWAVALMMFALAAVALVAGVTTGWDRATFRLFYLFGAVLNVPWLALGTVYLLLGERAGRRSQNVLLLFTGVATGVLLSAPMHRVGGKTIPVGKDVFGAFPRILAAMGSGVGALVVLAGALWSAYRALRTPGASAVRIGRRLAGANALIAVGTLVLASGGLIQGTVGHDEAFTLTLTIGIAVIYAGFRLAPDSSMRA